MTYDEREAFIASLTAELRRRLDGPHGDEHTASAADLAAETVRYLNHATGVHVAAGVNYPGTVYAVTAGLSLTAGRMPQLCGQLTGWLNAALGAGYLGVDNGSDPAGPVAEAVADLAVAATLAARLSGVLAGVQSALGSVNARGNQS